MPRTAGPPEVLEARRRAALNLVDGGMSYNAAAKVMGVSASSVLRWDEMRKTRKSLAVRQSPGRPRRVPYETIRKLLQRERPKSADVAARLVNRKLKAHYHPEHVRRLLTTLGFKWDRDERYWSIPA